MTSGGRMHYPVRALPLLLVLLVLPLFAGKPRPAAASIDWHPERALAWADFKAAPNYKSPMDALTESGIDYTWTCVGAKFYVDVRAKFHPEKSWVKPGASAKLLRHEQGHFDITEIHARRLREKFSTLQNPCAVGEEAFRAAARTVLDDWHAMQDRYDAETQHSNHTARQAEWFQFIEAELARLSKWAL